MPALAERLNRIKVAASVAMAVKARELRAAGKPVVTLTTGEPMFDTPSHAVESAHQAALRGDTKYPPQDGIRTLKEAVQAKFMRDSELDYALDEISVSNGAKQCIFNALMVTVDPGDEVVIPAPSWIAYAQMATIAEGKPVFVQCTEKEGFKPQPEDISAAVTLRTKWLILNNPNNPTGACCSAERLKEIAAVLRKHPQVWIMSDDVYEHLVFDGFRHATMAQVAPDLKDRTLTVSGVSKTYAMTGWRIGFAGGPKRLIKAMVNMQGQATAGVSTVGQAAATAALSGAIWR
jgi:aspartate aminotransferase